MWPTTPSTSAAMLAALIHLFPKHNLLIWRWARALNFIFLSGTCPVKPLYGLGYRAAAQFQGLGNSLRHLYVEQRLFFRSSESSLPWGAMLNFQWPEWESECDKTKFNTPSPHSHLRSCNTNESHDTGERKWLIGPNLEIFTKGSTHFCGQRFRH